MTVVFYNDIIMLVTFAEGELRDLYIGIKSI